MQQLEARIDLGRIVSNAALVSERAGVPLIAVVKDDAYGHGAERVAHALEGRVRAFAVATVEEGAALRVAGILSEILVLTPCLCGEEVLRGAEYGLTLSVSSEAAFRLLLRAKAEYGLRPAVQIAVNTGMNRYGFRPERTRAACKEILRSGLNVTGCYSHFYAPAERGTREEQYLRFCAAEREIRSFFPGICAHLAATGGILAGRKYAFDAVRCGIALYGYLPEEFRGALPVRPAMKLYATVSQRGRAAGGGAGYQHAERDGMALNTLRVGYGDGLFRAGAAGAIGKLCMDAAVAEGDRPFGARKRILRDLGGYARSHGTTEYEALVNLTKRAVKTYV